MSEEIYLLLGVFYNFILVCIAIKTNEKYQIHITKELTPEEIRIQKNNFLNHEKEVELEIKMLKKIRENLIRISLEHSQPMA